MFEIRHSHRPRSFGRYNPEAVKEISSVLDEILKDSAFVEATRPFYNARLKERLRDYFKAFRGWEQNPESLVRRKASLLFSLRDLDLDF